MVGIIRPPAEIFGRNCPPPLVRSGVSDGAHRKNHQFMTAITGARELRVGGADRCCPGRLTVLPRLVNGNVGFGRSPVIAYAILSGYQPPGDAIAHFRARLTRTACQPEIEEVGQRA